LKTIRFLIFLFGIPLTIKAQDPHFSQYFSSPLTLNPANTGNFEGTSRIASNFRNQWQGIGNPFQTGTISYDTEIFTEKVGVGNKLAAGVVGLYDKALGGKFKSNYISASLAYHLWMDEDRKKKLSIGFQSTFANKRIDPLSISFANQFGSFGFNLNLPSNEFVANNNISYFDWNAGMMYTHAGENGSVYLGTSAYHLTTPNESFLNNSTVSIPMRFTAHAGATRFIGQSGVLMGSSIFMKQGASNELTLGMAYGQYLSSLINNVAIYMGGWYRNNESVIPYFGLTYNNIQIGLSYDVVTSGLNLAKTQNRSFEVSVIYSFKEHSDYKRFIPWY
jgi:type IX secretion system PorP/SprF family membrane protein